MSEEKRKQYCSVDHANKQSEAFGSDPYQFWLNQVRRRRAMRARDTRRSTGNDSESGSGQME